MNTMLSKYRWIAGGIPEFVYSNDLSTFYYSDSAVRFDNRIILNVAKNKKIIHKDEKIYKPLYVCGAISAVNLDAGEYKIRVRLPIGKHLLSEIKIVNKFIGKGVALQVLKAYTGKNGMYSRIFRKKCNVMTYTLCDTTINNMHVHEKSLYNIDVNNEIININVVVRDKFIRVKFDNKKVLLLDEAIKPTGDKFANTFYTHGLMFEFKLGVTKDYKQGDLMRGFEIISFDKVS